MVDLSKAVQPEPTPAVKAREAVAKYRTQRNEDLYNDLLNIIALSAEKGVVALDLRYYNDEDAYIVESLDTKDAYINGTVAVCVNIASLVDSEALITSFKHAGFRVETFNHDQFGRVIDTISWN